MTRISKAVCRMAALITEAQTDPVFAAEYQRRVVKPRRGQARAVFRRAIDRGEIPADTNIEVAIDLLYGPLYHRLLHRHAPLNGRFTQDVIEMALGAIQPTTGQAAPLVTADDARLASALAHPPPTRQFW